MVLFVGLRSIEVCGIRLHARLSRGFAPAGATFGGYIRDSIADDEESMKEVLVILWEGGGILKRGAQGQLTGGARAFIFAGYQ